MEDQDLEFESDFAVEGVDFEAAKKLTGLYTNRIFVQHLGEGMIRLNFGEIFDPTDPRYHTALVLTAANAIAFAGLIDRIGGAVSSSPSFATEPEVPANGD